MVRLEKLFYKKGAEAELIEKIVDSKKVLIKRRIPKSYRDKNFDKDLRKKRLRGEVKLLKAAYLAVNVPSIISVDEEKAEIVMEFIQGVVLKNALEKNPSLCKEAGKQIKKLHKFGIIHGDLTTSNIIFSKATKDSDLAGRIKKNGHLFFIDFGLGYFSTKLEDQATDLVVFKKTFNSTHSNIKKGWEKVMLGYEPSKDFEDKMKAIEKRARYH